MTHLSRLFLSNYFFKLFVLDENLSVYKHEDVNIVDSNLLGCSSWILIALDEASNSNSDSGDDLVQSPHRFGRSPKNAFIVVGKTTEITSHNFVGVKLDVIVTTSLEI